MITKPAAKEEQELYDEPYTGKSKDVPIERTDDEPQNVRVNFQDEDLASQYASQQTKTSKDNGGIDPNKSADDVEKDVRDYENSRTNKLEYKDLLKTAEFLINLI